MNTILISGHRGFPKKYPMNTLPSIEAAIKLGCPRVEYDVHWTRDRKIVICHNSTIDDTSNGKGEIASMTFDELRKYDFGSWKSERFVGTKIPTLAEVLDLAKKLNPKLLHFVEVKVESVEFAEAVIAELNSHNLKGCFRLNSFHLELLKEMKKRHPEIMLNGNPDMSLSEFNYEDYRLFDSIGLFRDRVTPEIVRGFHSVGTEVDAWTVDNEEEFLRQLKNGVDSVTSNNPELIINYAKHINRGFHQN